MDFGFSQVVPVIALIVGIIQLYQSMRQTTLMQAQAAGATAEISLRDRVKRVWKTPGLFALSFLVFLAWLPKIIADVWPSETFQLVQYGYQAPLVFHASVPTTFLGKYKDQYRVMLIVRIQYGDIDRMRDRAIEKSIPYTIDGQMMNMYLAAHNNPLKLRVFSNAPTLNIEYDGVLIPSSVTPDDIETLADVGKIGGKILDATVQMIPTADLVQPVREPLPLNCPPAK